MRAQDITIYGDGTQTRSFQHVHDLVSGLIALMESDYSQPVNLGNPEEYTILDVCSVAPLHYIGTQGDQHIYI
jgi:UDP-glucuronate decarboxylase